MFTGAYTAMYNVALNPGESYQLSCEVEYGAYGDVAAFESWNNARKVTAKRLEMVLEMFMAATTSRPRME